MRIVSLCPSITESLVAIGLADALVGATRFCIHPKEALLRHFGEMTGREEEGRKIFLKVEGLWSASRRGCASAPTLASATSTSSGRIPG